MYSSATTVETTAVRRGLEVENSIGMETSANTVDVGKTSAANTNGGLSKDFNTSNGIGCNKGLEDNVETSAKKNTTAAKNTNVMMIDVMKVYETPQVNTEEEFLLWDMFHSPNPAISNR